jgi:hypothetical protein
MRRVKTQSLRTTLVFALVASIVWVFITTTWGGATTREGLFGFPVFFAVIFFTMRLSNRLTTFAVGRWGPKPPPPQPKGPARIEASEEQAEHSRRRRSRRHRARRRR